MPPEAVDSKTGYTAKMDSFSLGVLLLEICAQSGPSSGLKNIGGVIEVMRRDNDLTLLDDAHPHKPLIVWCLQHEKLRPAVAVIHNHVKNACEATIGKVNWTVSSTCVRCFQSLNTLSTNTATHVVCTVQYVYKHYPPLHCALYVHAYPVPYLNTLSTDTVNEGSTHKHTNTQIYYIHFVIITTKVALAISLMYHTNIMIHYIRSDEDQNIGRRSENSAKFGERG